MSAADDSPEHTVKSLLTHYPVAGVLTWIGLRPEHGAPVVEAREVELLQGHGLLGDVTSTGRGGGKRQVTLMQEEHLEVIAKLTGHAKVAPAWLRRNFVVRVINLHALRGQRFHVGDALLEGSGTCDPCSKMEEVLGFGGYNAMRGHGGITARVVSGAIVRVGDPVRFESAALLSR